MSSEVVEIALMREYPRLAESSIECLIERVKAGDRAAFDGIMEHYQRRIVSMAWRILGNQEDARDAAQEVFLRAYKYAGSFKRGEDPSAWLYRITVNVCRDVLKKRRKHRGIISLEMAEELGQLDKLANTDDLEGSAIRNQERDLVLRALAVLSRKEREAIVLRDLEGFSTEEVARILGSSQPTVRSQISSARAKIKQYRDRVLNRGRGGPRL